MKKTVIAAASLMFVATAQAQTQPDQMMDLGVDMTPIVKQEKPATKWDARFSNYSLENSAAGGQ